MTKLLNLGQAIAPTRAFTIPIDAVTRTFAILGIRGAGKSTTAKVMAEEFCEAGQPWIALDPVGIWWGIRAMKNGQPSKYPVVVFGGKHADIPISKEDGKKIAEALVHENICAVIDLKMESKTFWRKFITDFSLHLLELEPETPRHIFLEEAPEFVPQRTSVMASLQCKEAVERLVRLGRNFGYGATLISQRAAKIDKDVLSQCDSVFAMQQTHNLDRKAINEWINDKYSPTDHLSLEGLSKLKPGNAFFWSPSWLERFDRVKIREAHTFHPGATKKVGATSLKKVKMADVGSFVSKLTKQLSKTQVAVQKTAAPASTPKKKAKHEPIESLWADQSADLANALAELEELKQTVAQNAQNTQVIHSQLQKARSQIDKLRKAFAPQYDAFTHLFSDEMGPDNGSVADQSVYEVWRQKAGSEKALRRRMLDFLIERKELTKNQLATLCGSSPRGGNWNNSLSWLRTNQLAETDGKKIRLIPV